MKLSFFILSIVISMTNSAFAVKAVDFSDLTSKYAFQCTKRNGYERIIIKGYFEAWGRNPGGSIDRNFLQNYKNAQAAGPISTYICFHAQEGRLVILLKIRSMIWFNSLIQVGSSSKRFG